MNADGNFTGDSMGAGAADLTTVRDFDPATGRLKAIKSGLAGATAAQFNRYIYDHLGNTTERHDDNMNVHETFNQVIGVHSLSNDAPTLFAKLFSFRGGEKYSDWEFLAE